MKYARRCLFALFVFAGAIGLSFIHAADGVMSDKKPVKVSVMRFYDPNNPENATTQRLIKLMNDIPGLDIECWGGIRLPGSGAKSSLMMAIAGKTAPDIGESWFHIISNEIYNGFLFPLNKWVGEDTNGNGQIDPSEAKWEGWKKVPPLWRRVATRDGKVYGIPQVYSSNLGVIFRIDLIRAAGLDPNNPPKTWEEFMYWCHKLTNTGKEIAGTKTNMGQRGVALAPYGWTFLPWIQSAGGDPIIQYKVDPEDGKHYYFPAEATEFHTPSGKDLSREPSVWQADFTSKAAIAAAKLYHDIIWKKWVVDPQNGEPVSLSNEDIRRGEVSFKDRILRFKQEEIITGVGRAQTGQRGEGVFDYLSTGEVGMVVSMVSDLNSTAQRINISPDLISWFPFPRGPFENGHRVVQVQRHYAVMYEGVGRRTEAEQDMVWKTLTAICDDEVRKNSIREKVLSGLARFAHPEDLKMMGYDEYLNQIPAAVRKNYEEIDKGVIAAKTEPFMGFWFTVDQAINREVLGRIISQTGEDFDYKGALAEVQRKANSGMMFQVSDKELDGYRPTARFVFMVVLSIVALLVIKITRQNIKNRKRLGESLGSTNNVYNKWLAWGMVLPALILIGLWSYYPLIRGMVMAFQDYKVTGNSEFVGLNNFILLFLDTSFWMSLLRTLYFVLLNMLLAFTAPIILAVLLTDVPRFKIFFRTIFFLPQMSSGLVVALLWKLMYEPTPQGFFNQIIAIINYLPFVDIPSQQWLQDPSLAMVCVVLPTVWASMGMSSLIYLAAVGSIPRDLYEAAEIDGASIGKKFISITLPTIFPLIIINFVGAFIGTFQNMGNIFLMTFGGPGESTTVIGFKIWVEAYANLRFSMATSMAWVLGSLLIGFTYFQIKFLGKIEYKRAK